MDFDVFFSKKDKQDAVNAARAMVFLPENCYFVEDPPPEIYFFLNDKKEIMAKIIVSYKNHVTESIVDKPLTLKFHEKGLKQSWEFINIGQQDSWLV